MSTEAAERYWDEVRRELQERLKIPPDAVRSGVSRYREELAAHGVGRLLYNQPAARTAEAIQDLLHETKVVTD